MSEITFIHLSDIHFRKTSGSSTDIDEDLRNAILTDIQYNTKKRLQNIKGVLVGGDIAFAGKREEYDIAKKFLGSLTSCLEIDEKNIYCVPGNHDVDQKVAQNSRSVYNAQCEIENAETLDDADWYLDKHMSDAASPNLLFKPIEEYNNFAVLYGCNINMDRTYWTADFDLDCSMKLKIRGMNSCIISNHDDHKVKGVDRKMYVGQSQLPSYEADTVWVSLCHHPVEYWKFDKDIQSRLDKRVDIQLYGHKHEQFMDRNDERLAINAGATHPTRGRDWMPRYNWISFESYYQGNDKCIRVKVFPRILSSDRDRFILDQGNCDLEKDYFEYTLNVDKKRRDNLSDNLSGKKEIKYINADDKIIVNGIKKDIIYHFFELSYIQQSEILSKLCLLRDEYAGKKYIEIIDVILKDAESQKCLEEFYTMINRY